MNFTFNVHDGVNANEVKQDDINRYAELCGLNEIANGRYSALFVVNLMLLETVNGVDPFHVIDEIKYLEGIIPSLQTKQEAEFKGAHLKGLWHKHFMPALVSVMAHNIMNQLGRNGTKRLVEEVLDPSKSEIITREMLDELSHRLVIESMENRAAQEKLTGEWIVYAKEAGANYYLGIWRHDAGDENIAETIKTTCMPQFPFLSKYVS